MIKKSTNKNNNYFLCVWQVRVGEVGGTSLGLYGAVFGPRGDYFLAHSYHGFFNLWKKIAVGKVCIYYKLCSSDINGLPIYIQFTFYFPVSLYQHQSCFAVT